MNNQALKKSQVQEEALRTLDDHNRHGTVAISMRVGKTLIGLKHLDKYKEAKALIVAPKLSIFEAWKEEAIKFNLNHLLEKITFSTYLSLPKQSLDYTVVYLDEVHNVLESHVPWLKEFKGDIIGLTGTLPDKQSDKYRIIQRFCPLVYSYTVKEAIDHEVINDCNIIVHLLPLEVKKTLTIMGKNKTFVTSEKASYDWWSKKIALCVGNLDSKMLRIHRMKALQSYISKDIYTRSLLNTIKQKCIIFTNTKIQAMKICNNQYFTGNKDNEKNLEDFKSGKINRLSCVLMLSEGATIPDLKECIIQHAYANNNKLSQRLARCLSLSPKEVATVHVLCYKDTVDEEWVDSALQAFDKSKITYKDTTL